MPDKDATGADDALDRITVIGGLHSIASGYTVGETYRESAKVAIRVLENLAADRDEWKRQHENLVEVRRRDLAVLTDQRNASRREVERSALIVKTLNAACERYEQRLIVAETDTDDLRAENERLREALRARALLTWRDDTTGKTGEHCTECDHEWTGPGPEKHAPGCLAALSAQGQRPAKAGGIVIPPIDHTGETSADTGN